MLVEGRYPESAIPNYLEKRYGTAAYPVIIQSADGRGKAILEGDLNIFDCRYIYLIDFTIRPVPAGDTLHFELCDHILMRGLELDGGVWTGEGQSAPIAQETTKAPPPKSSEPPPAPEKPKVDTAEAKPQPPPPPVEKPKAEAPKPQEDLIALKPKEPEQIGRAHV